MKRGKPYKASVLVFSNVRDAILKTMVELLSICIKAGSTFYATAALTNKKKGKRLDREDPRCVVLFQEANPVHEQDAAAVAELQRRFPKAKLIWIGDNRDDRMSSKYLSQMLERPCFPMMIDLETHLTTMGNLVNMATIAIRDESAHVFDALASKERQKMLETLPEAYIMQLRDRVKKTNPKLSRECQKIISRPVRLGGK